MKIIMLYSILLFSFNMIAATAQNSVTVNSFKQTTDHIPGNDRRNDFNGDPCALIKVYVVDDIDRIEGNKIGDIEKRGNVEKWVYMCKGSRNIRIHLKNHLPVRVMFQDYQISGLESNRVYELVIETPDAHALLDTEQNKLNEQGTREITERLTAEKTNLPEPEISWEPTYYTKSMLKGEGAFQYNGIYYIIISHERRTVAIVKPKRSKYDEPSYVIPSQVLKGNELYTVTEIAPFAFSKSKNLRNIVLPETLEAIGEGAFAFCGELDHFTFPPNLRYIGRMVFIFDKISELILPDSIEEIADEAFLLCKKRIIIGHTDMGKLYIPNTVKKIGKHAFAGFKNVYGSHMTAKFDIQNLPDWVTPSLAKKIGLHEDSYSDYVQKKRK